MPEITEDQLWDFYVRNDICEVGYGKETAVKPLKFPAYIVGAFYEDKLVGLIRAMFDGLSADIREFCLECELQGDNPVSYTHLDVYKRQWLHSAPNMLRTAKKTVTARIPDSDRK